MSEENALIEIQESEDMSTRAVVTQDVTASTLSPCHVSMCLVDDDFNAALSLARDSVKGHSEDYYFFQFDSDEYVLIFSDDLGTNEGGSSLNFLGYDCTAIVFQAYHTRYLTQNQISLTGEITEVGTNPSVDSVTLSGTVQGSDLVYTNWQIRTIDNFDCYVYNDGYAAYSSYGDDIPKLTEGVDYYASAGLALAVGVCVFSLTDRIFSRVSRVR